MRTIVILMLGAGLALGGCASRPQPGVMTLGQAAGMPAFGQPQVSGAALERLLAEADKHPLGSRENPVRAEMPGGQRAYLARLRCSDGRAPAFVRSGNLGPGVFGNIVDLYQLTCAGAAPGRAEVIMDMYHPGHVENRPVPGFTMDGGPIV